jgi:RNA polymerase sigma factor (sigma-70 family)
LSSNLAAPIQSRAADVNRSLLAKLRRLLRSRGRTAEDSDDLIQEAFLRLQVYCREKVVAQSEAFLVRTALNLSIDDRRRARNRTAVASPLEALSIVDLNPKPDEVYEAEQRFSRVRAALDALSPRCREVFLLHRVDGCSYGQIAAQLSISVSTVEKHMAKAAMFIDSWSKAEREE